MGSSFRLNTKKMRLSICSNKNCNKLLRRGMYIYARHLKNILETNMVSQKASGKKTLKILPPGRTRHFQKFAISF